MINENNTTNKKDNHTLSLCMIIKDEELVLDRCLSIASQIYDELIVIDTGSTDKSVEIAKKYTNKVFPFEWKNNFSDARNFSFSKATCDYVMWLDADDIIDDDNVNRLIDLKNNLSSDAVFTIYQNYSENGLYYYFLRERIFKRSINPVWQYAVHENIVINPSYKVEYRTDIAITHKKEKTNEANRDLKILSLKTLEDSPLDVYEKSNYCKELALAQRYDEAYQVYKEILNSKAYIEIYCAMVFVQAGLMRQNRYEECLHELDYLNKNILSTAFSVYKQGECEDRLGNYNEAENLYKKALTMEENPLTLAIQFKGYNDYFPYIRLALLEIRKGNMDLASKYVETAGKNYPKHQDWQKIRDKFLLN